MESPIGVAKSLVYRFVELCSGGRGLQRVINGQSVRFPSRWSRYYESNYEAATFEFLRAHLKPGSTLLDVGGHIGLFAVVGAKLVGEKGKVFTFEPTPFTRNVLSEVVKLNNCSDIVEVRGEAVSCRSGKMLFHDTGEATSNANSLVKIDRAKTCIEVDVISLDEFISERKINPHCLKIDVEGAELDLLRGAKETFLRFRPSARLGLHPQQIKKNGQSLEEIWQTLTDYELTPEFEDRKVEKEWFCNQHDLFDVNLKPF